MEKKIFPAPAVAEVLDGMVEARLHTDGGDATSAFNKELQLELTDSVATPIYVVQDPVTGTTRIGQMKADFLSDAEVFAAFLKKARTQLAMGADDRPKVARGGH